MISARDQAAFEAFATAGKFHVATSLPVAEHDTEHGVFLALAHVLRQVSARVEHADDGDTFKTLSFAVVHDDEPLQSDTPRYPAAYLESLTAAELDAMILGPVTEEEDGERVDVVTDEWALWKLGEDSGEANVKIWATTEVETRAMAHAVRETLAGDIDTFVSMILPMPERYLPPPFRGRFAPEQTPSCAITLRDSRGRPTPGAEAGVWSVDIEFGWRATRFTARPRIADFRPFLTVSTEP